MANLTAIPNAKAILAMRAKRAAGYPDFRDYLDGVVKSASLDPAIKAAGEAQLAAYVAGCMAVKAKYPKPQ